MQRLERFGYDRVQTNKIEIVVHVERLQTVFHVSRDNPGIPMQINIGLEHCSVTGSHIRRITASPAIHSDESQNVDAKRLRTSV